MCLVTDHEYSEETIEDSVNAPILMVHGTKTKPFPLLSREQMLNAIVEMGRRVYYVEPDKGHFLTDNIGAIILGGKESRGNILA